MGRTLTAWGRADLVECAQLVIGELVANAVQATADVTAAGADLGAPGGQGECQLGIVGVGLYRIGGRVVLEVWDCSRLPPKLVNPSAEDVGGRGLLLVDALAAVWGYRLPVTGGKVVYAILDEVA
ncbi:ATP-binding protein [Acrocarpospora sp. B8E8]|uniref:ATP-binding protein n=1 Tax=Acrocarpospora sp. B8E8 TaxID=3153572 RepID=UPI00325D984D